MVGTAPQFRIHLVCLTALAIASGCSGGPGDGFKGKRGQVSGTVTVGDKPAPKDTQVMFVSKEGGYTATGLTDDKGKYTLRYKESAGLPEGEYFVQLTPPTAASAPSTGPVDPSQMGAKLKLSQKAGSSGGATASPFAKKYLSTATSKLSSKVEAKANVADFKLDSE